MSNTEYAKLFDKFQLEVSKYYKRIKDYPITVNSIPIIHAAKCIAETVLDDRQKGTLGRKINTVFPNAWTCVMNNHGICNHAVALPNIMDLINYQIMFDKMA